MAQLIKETKMKVPLPALFAAITDFSNYPVFVSEVVGAKVVKKIQPNKLWVEFELEVIKKFIYTLEFELKDNREVAWKLIKSDFFKQNEGRWVLTAAGKTETLVHYELDLSVAFMVPGWISKKLTETNLPRMFESFESHAKEISKQ